MLNKSWTKSQWAMPLLGALVLWSASLSVGFNILFSYEARPGPKTSTPQQWPSESALQFDRSRANLLLFVHPHCPCSRATIAEVAKLLTRYAGKLDVQIMMYKPAALTVNWTQTDLWDGAAKLPGVRLKIDQDGTEATRFHALISGQTLLYDSRGHLLFAGGITQGRGHVGANRGSEAIAVLLDSGNIQPVSTPVFGCYLHGQVQSPTKERDE